MKLRRFLAAAMTAVMLLAAVPSTMFAAGGESKPAEEGKLFLDKTATLTDDGSYTINMEAFATGKTTTQTIEKGVPLDIVLVLDQSGSMGDKMGKEDKQTKQEALKTAAKNFVEKVYQDGQKHNVEHRIGIATFAGGNGKEENKENNTKYKYMHTGIYDQSGKFVGYKATSNSKPSYQKFDGTMETNGTYFVLVNGEYVQLSYNKGADEYKPVTNPATARKDLYGKINGKYQKATYGEYTETKKTEVTSPVKGTTGYVDANGNPLTWMDKAVNLKDAKGFTDANKIEWGKHYYIKYGRPTKHHEIWVQNGAWTDDGGSKYNTAKDGSRDIFTWGLSNYYAYVPTPANTKTVLTTPDGKEYTGKVYTQTTETKTGWNVKGVPVTELYEIQKGVYKWQYKAGSKFVDLKPTDKVYVQTTGSVFGPALVPVADGVNGAGNKRANFDTAINRLAAEGPTRTALGVELGNKIFEANPIPAGSDRQRIMIVFTDGEPGWSEYDSKEASAAVAQTKITKETYGAKVYTIGLYNKEGTDQKKFMEDMSSNTATDKKYYNKVSNADALNKVFQSIQEDISGSTTSVDLTATSILRDIMSDEGFELTDKSVITVSVVPGDASKATSEKDINWGTPVQVLTLTDPYDGKSVMGVYPDSAENTENKMTITASTHMKNPEAGKADLHTVDVTGFDYKDQYIAQAHKGSKLVVEITGVKALPTVTTDQNIYTNHEQSGIWAPNTTVVKAPFPEMPQTYMPSKSYVVDYAKPLTLATTDFKMDTAKNIDMDGYDPFTTTAPNKSIDPKYGKVTLNGQKMNYVPQTMNWDGYDTFYVFGTTNDATVKAASANANGNVWGKVNVIPANNVYYEDSFITNESNGTVGIKYTGIGWQDVAPSDSNNSTQAEGTDVQGWIPALENETGDTAGSSHHAIIAPEADPNTTATATFTFTGTGVDVYSRTSGQTGTVVATIKDLKANKVLKTLIVDTKSASGNYYQIPTLTFQNLTYGPYEVMLMVTKGAQSEGRLEYYLDGIRVYNPVLNGDPVVDGAYGKDEMNASFKEVRNILLDTKSFSADNNTVGTGFVFIDELTPGTAGNTDQVLGVGTYQDLGPKNEVYLKNGQAISFKVDTTLGNQFQIGLKSPTGASVSASVGSAQTKKNVTLSHTADMYYIVQADQSGVITVMNNSDALLSVTKLKVTNESAPVAAVFAETDTPALVNATRTFMAAPVAPVPDPDIDIPEPPVEPEQPSKPSIGDILHDIFHGIFGWM